MEYKYLIKNNIGYRTIANIVYKLQAHKCNVWVTSDDRRVNANSIIGLLSLNLKNGDDIVITADNDTIDVLQIFKTEIEGE